MVVDLFSDFKAIALCEKKPFFNEALYASASQSCENLEERLILSCFFRLNRALRITNMFKQTGIPAAICFRFDPSVLLEQKPRELYPETPFGVYMIMGRGFLGSDEKKLEIIIQNEYYFSKIK